MVMTYPPESTAVNATGGVMFDTLNISPEVYCETFEAKGIPREHWQSLITMLDNMGNDELKQLQDRINLMRHEDGATFNPFDDPNDQITLWALDIIPLLLTTVEWTTLETGLIQRARLLEEILRDVYGPRKLLNSNQLPAELVFANPNFLHQCHEIQPAGKRFLVFYAADIYRDSDGQFKVYRDYGANPVGIGYALENRIALSRLFSKIYHKVRTRRLAPFFQTFHQNLVQRAELRGDDPAVVLLSPGPDNRFYFEHALLSRYLNYPLVEGQDLTVRNGEVFLRKLTGLEPVEAIFRHISDHSSDPFALRRGTETGVPGLIQVSRERNIDIINPIGSGFVDTPALPAVLPALCRHILGEDLMLQNHPIWWCNTPSERDHVCANLQNLTLLPAMERSAGPLPRDLQQAIQDRPYAFIAKAPVSPAIVPVWEASGVRAAHALMRIFVCASEQGFSVMPGGLAIVADNVDALTSDCPEKQWSKDIWVLSDKPVEPFSLMNTLHTPAEFIRSNDLPSRVADNLLWMGRYLERAEGRVRILRAVFRRLSGEDRLSDIPELPFLLNLLRAQHIIPEASEEEADYPRFRSLSGQLRNALHCKDQPESMASVLQSVRQTTRNLRDWFSMDTWRAINHLENFDDISGNDPLEFLNDTLFALNAFSGLAMESMTRGLGWCFMDMGRRIERGINLAELIRIGFPQVCISSRSALETLLEMTASIMTYRARYRTTFQLAPVLDLLLIDESNPRSLAFQCSRLADHVAQLPRQGQRRFSAKEERIALDMLTAVRLLELGDLDCSNDNPEIGALSEFLESIKIRFQNFSETVSAHYLTRIPSTPHYATIPDEIG